DPLVAECLQWMSYLKLMQGDKERALEYCQRARAVHDNVNRKDQQEAALLVHLARLYEQLDRRKEAGQLLREARLVRRQLLGEGDPLVIETLNEVAMNAVAQSNQVEADAAFRRILSEYEKS